MFYTCFQMANRHLFLCVLEHQTLESLYGNRNHFDIYVERTLRSAPFSKLSSTTQKGFSKKSKQLILLRPKHTDGVPNIRLI